MPSVSTARKAAEAPTASGVAVSSADEPSDGGTARKQDFIGAAEAHGAKTRT